MDDRHLTLIDGEGVPKKVPTLAANAAAAPREITSPYAEAVFEAWAEHVIDELTADLDPAVERERIPANDRVWLVYALRETAANLKRLLHEADQISEGFGLRMARVLSRSLGELASTSEGEATPG